MNSQPTNQPTGGREVVIPEFSIDEIEDVRIIIKANGKHYGIVPKSELLREEAKLTRVAMLTVIFENHAVVNKALEDLNQ